MHDQRVKTKTRAATETMFEVAAKEFTEKMDEHGSRCANQVVRQVNARVRASPDPIRAEASNPSSKNCHLLAGVLGMEMMCVRAHLFSVEASNNHPIP
jgi:hypothetical protein